MRQISSIKDMKAIVRQSYLDKITKHLGKDTIIIIVGQRRVGKSYTLRLFRDKVAEDAHANIIFIDKEKHEYADIQTDRDLNAYIDERRDKRKTNYILIDEVQDIAGFENSIRSYYEEPDIEIVVTGSNSNMLSSDLANKIGGRYKEIFVQALSYKEFMELLKDVIKRNNIRNVPFLENLVHFLADNVGKIISANSIAKYMRSQGENITSTAIINYAKYLCESYMIHKVNRYDIHGRKLFESNDKFYFEDNGIRNALVGGSRERDIEKVIENIIYNHLVRLGYEVMVGQLQAGEIDFVCTKPKGERIYVQASYIIADDNTYEREFGNLRAIKDNYPKYVISMTPLVTKSDDNGITHLHLRRFLTEGLER